MLSDAESELLRQRSSKAGLSMQAYLRALIHNRQLKEQPSVDFFTVLKRLDNIGNNMNQIAVRANSTGNIYAEEYRKNVDELFRVVNELLRKAYS